MMPTHEVCNMNGMTRNRFRFLWRHLHINHADIDDEYDNVGDGGDDEEEEHIVEMTLERVQVEEDEEQI